MKKEMYQAVGFTALLVASSLPLSFVAMQALNLVFGMIAV
jgi:hypothetical protein